MNQKILFTKLIPILVLAAIVMHMTAPAIMRNSDVQASSADSISQETGTEWEAWFIRSEASLWSDSEVAMVREALENSIFALDEAGFDGRLLLDGYRFRRTHEQFVDGIDGRIALVRHAQKEIILADTAFMRLWGYYIYHELGHVVDKQLGRELTQQFHVLASKGASGSSSVTPDGFWLNGHARSHLEEATADAFALWVVMRYTDNPKPVFWNMPNTTDYELIVETFEETLQEIG